ncbi:Defensin-2 [Ooceraea biroi]|uniref:Defensin-2 n=1 Tax=Ooceraea biroi TaxID=2015173 RepID=A0A026WVD4_OOCBI|nr:Defensin-2 [Ooceraea biroi]
MRNATREATRKLFFRQTLRESSSRNHVSATIDDPTYDETASDLTPIRQRRVTCDLLSWQSKWLSINHSACAAKCLAQRRRGGRCRDGICICRN